VDGIVFFAALSFILYKLVSSKSHQPDAEHEADTEHLSNLPTKRAWFLFALGLTLLIISSEVLVWGAKEIATAFGVSELIIGLTVVAVGTSLPELATTIASALKGHHDIALGNILGSNLFNLLAVMGVPALISQPVMDPVVFSRDYLSMTAITFLLAAILYGHQILIRYFKVKVSGQQSQYSYIGRFEGALLLLAYGAYYYLLFPAVS
jgi:cation:H+ antiporter